MSLVAASGLSLAFGPKVLFKDASFTIAQHDRIGLVGANGTGKSSLLKILAGEASPDGGALAWRRGARAGYLPQDVSALPPGPLLETVLASVPGRSVVEARLAAAEEGAPRRQRARGAARAGAGAGRPPRRARPLRGAPRAPPRRAAPGRARLLHRGPGARHGHALRRLAHAGGAGRAPPAGPRPAPARRADEPPRRADPHLVRRLPARLQPGAGAHLPRPRVPQPADRQGAGARAGGAALLPGRLRPATGGCGPRRRSASRPRRSARRRGGPSCRASSTASAPRTPRRGRRRAGRRCSTGWRRWRCWSSAPPCASASPRRRGRGRTCCGSPASRGPSARRWSTGTSRRWCSAASGWPSSAPTARARPRCSGWWRVSSPPTRGR